MKPRIKAVALVAVLAGALAGPSVSGAVAATTQSANRVTLTRAQRRELKELKELKALQTRDASTSPPSGPALAVQDGIQNLEFDVSSDGIQALLGDFPLVGDYG
jgi:protein-disulfide isomerase